MKRFLILAGIVLLAATCLWAVPTETRITDSFDPGASGVDKRTVEPVASITRQRTWEAIASVSSVGEEPNDLAVGERTYTTVAVAAEGGDDKITIVKIPPSWSYIRFRCIGITNDANVVFQVYSGTLANDSDCVLVKVAQLSFVIGTQSSTVSTYELADTLTLTEYCKILETASDSPTGELVAEAAWDLEGDDILVIVPTTVECNAKLLAKGFSGG